MTKTNSVRRAAIGTAIAALMVPSLGAGFPASAQAAPIASVRPTSDVTVSVGSGRMVRLEAPISDLFVANDAIADVQVRSANQIYVFGKAAGQTTIFATNKAGKVVFSANVRVGNNFESVDDMLRLAMPEADLKATPMNGAVLLTGTVLAPVDVEEATRLVQAFVGDGVQVLTRVRTATPQQVLLKVKIAEVNRSLLRQIGVNLASRDSTGGFLFGIGRGNPGTITPVPGGGSSFTFNNNPAATTLAFAGDLLGLDLLSTLDLSENSALVTTLAEPSLAALSGESASFLAGGEFPIVISNGIQGNSIEFKQYGVSLSFIPFVLDGGRISLRVRPEVSELTSDGAIRVNGFEVPAVATRRAETTVELGSGQSFMIGGLIRNNINNSVEKAPFLGDIPILGSLFRSTGFRKNETELVIVVTPYLVKPVSASQIALPTDGFRAPDEGKRLFLDQRNSGRSGEQRPTAEPAAPRTVAPGVGPFGALAVPPAQPAPPPVQQAQRQPARPAAAAPRPGFSF